MTREGDIPPRNPTLDKPSTDSIMTISDEWEDNFVKPVVKPSWWQKLNETCFFEGLGFSIGASCLIVTAGILYYYEDERAPYLPVTLNFIMALLGNVAFASTLFGMHSAVSQLKWIGFSQRSRPLSELDVFRRAGSGPLGAARLLLTATRRPLVIVASAAIILGMVWAPFTQNMVRYEFHSFEDESNKALLPRSVRYAGSRLTSAWNSYGRLINIHMVDSPVADKSANTVGPLDPLLIASIQAALLKPLSFPQSTSKNIQYYCTTGECTWPPFATLALRSSCADISQSILPFDCTKDQYCEIKLPGNNTPSLYYDNRPGKNSASYHNVSLLPPSETPQIFINKHNDTIIQALRMLPPYPAPNGQTNPITKANFPGLL